MKHCAQPSIIYISLSPCEKPFGDFTDHELMILKCQKEEEKHALYAKNSLAKTDNR